MDFKGKRVTVMGLGVFGGGVGVAKFLLREGARVTVTDTDTRERLAESVAAVGDAATYHLGGHVAEDFTGADLVVANPAVKPDSEWLRLARERGVPVTTEMNLFFERCPAPIAGITGSVGKTTTAAMVHRALEASVPPDRRVWLGGNIGKSLLLELPEMCGTDVVVLELSSAQLHYLGRAGLAPDVAVVTNLSQNHIDWHGSMEAYVAAKMNIVTAQGPGGTAVLNADDEGLREWTSKNPLTTRGTTGERGAAWFSTSAGVESGAFVRGGRIVLRRPGTMGDRAGSGSAAALPESAEFNVVEVGRMRLPGAHNVSNAAAAVAACGAVIAGWYADADGLADALRRAGAALESFEGAEHRLEFVAESCGVRYYNDSKATTPVSALAALDAFEAGRVVLILGGRDKGLDYSGLASRAAGCRAVVLVGEMAGRLDELLAARSGSLVRVRAGCVAEAVSESARLACRGDVVLLSPACTSYDQFRNFEERGRAFKEAVRRLKTDKGDVAAEGR